MADEWGPGHPRVGGEQETPRPLTIGARGSSPRGRGTDGFTLLRDVAGRVIPAWAGNRKYPMCMTIRWPGHPRVGGEQRFRARQHPVNRGSSPRGRGTGVAPLRSRLKIRVIPAWAGNRSRKA